MTQWSKSSIAFHLKFGKLSSLNRILASVYILNSPFINHIYCCHIQQMNEMLANEVKMVSRTMLNNEIMLYTIDRNSKTPTN